MSKERQPLSDRDRVSREVSNASLAEIVKIGLENDRDGKAARMHLQNESESLIKRSHLYRDKSRDIYWGAKESPFDFSGEWEPEATYHTTSTPEGVRVTVIEHDGFRIFDSVTDRESWDKTPPKQVLAVRESLHRIISAFEAPSHPLRVIPDVTAIRTSAHEQRQRHARNGNELLKTVKHLLNGVVHIGLDSLDEEVPDSPSIYLSYAYPTEMTDDERFQKNRKRRAEEVPTFLFRCEMEKLWNCIMYRQEEDWNFSSIVANAGFSPKVAKQYEKILFSLYRNLRSVDEAIVQSSSLETACTVVEAKIIEANRLPTVEEVMPDIGQAHHDRTIWIGKTLQLFKDDGGLPSVTTYRELSEWLATHVPEKVDVATVGRTRYRDALKATGCWCNTGSGRTEGLVETMHNAIRYAKNNLERGERG